MPDLSLGSEADTTSLSMSRHEQHSRADMIDHSYMQQIAIPGQPTSGTPIRWLLMSDTWKSMAVRGMSSGVRGPTREGRQHCSQ